jgi:hypothetical protein
MKTLINPTMFTIVKTTRGSIRLDDALVSELSAKVGDGVSGRLDGVALGATVVGCIVGISVVGCAVATIVGDAVIITPPVGATVGIAVDIRVGCMLGEPVGRLVGEYDG